MNISPHLAKVLVELDKKMQGKLNGTKISGISETISGYAIASAISSMLAGVLPGAAGVAAMLVQTGFVWATYVKINKELGISMSEETAKFLGSAIATNFVMAAGSMIVAYAAVSIISFVPLIGGVLSAAAQAAIGYIMIYACAIIYLRFITRMVKPDGSVEVSPSDDTSKIIKEIIAREDLKTIIKEGAGQYKSAKASGAIDAAKAKKYCPNCKTEYNPGDRFCSNCGFNLSQTS